MYTLALSTPSKPSRQVARLLRLLAVLTASPCKVVVVAAVHPARFLLPSVVVAAVKAAWAYFMKH
jgi:hypothetical protein